MPNQTHYKMNERTAKKASKLIAWIKANAEQGDFEFNCTTWLLEQRDCDIWAREMQQFRFFHNNIERIKEMLKDRITISFDEYKKKYIARQTN